MTIASTAMPASVVPASSTARPPVAAGDDAIAGSTPATFDALLQPTTTTPPASATATPATTPVVTVPVPAAGQASANLPATPADAAVDASVAKTPHSEPAVPTPTANLADLIAQLGLDDDSHEATAAESIDAATTEATTMSIEANTAPAAAAALAVDATAAAMSVPPSAAHATASSPHAAALADTGEHTGDAAIGAITAGNRAAQPASMPTAQPGHAVAPAHTTSGDTQSATPHAGAVFADAVAHAQTQTHTEAGRPDTHAVDTVETGTATAAATHATPATVLARAPHTGAATPTVLPQVAMPERPGNGFAEDFQGRIGVMLEQGIGHARIRIAPEHLGAIDLQLKVDGDLVTAQFNSGHADVRAAIEHSLPRLRDALAGQGLQLAQAQVSGGQAQAGQPGQGDASRQDPRDVATTPHTTATELASDSNVEDTALPAPAIPMQQVGLVDAYA